MARRRGSMTTSSTGTRCTDRRDARTRTPRVAFDRDPGRLTPEGMDQEGGTNVTQRARRHRAGMRESSQAELARGGGLSPRRIPSVAQSRGAGRGITAPGLPERTVIPQKLPARLHSRRWPCTRAQPAGSIPRRETAGRGVAPQGLSVHHRSAASVFVSPRSKRTLGRKRSGCSWGLLRLPDRAQECRTRTARPRRPIQLIHAVTSLPPACLMSGPLATGGTAPTSVGSSPLGIRDAASFCGKLVAANRPAKRSVASVTGRFSF